MLAKPYLAVYAPLLGHSAQMRAIREMVEQVAVINTTILFRGESGVGKDLVARAIPVLAFGSHIDAAALRAARDLGARAVPNSEVENSLRALLGS